MVILTCPVSPRPSAVLREAAALSLSDVKISSDVITCGVGELDVKVFKSIGIEDFGRSYLTGVIIFSRIDSFDVNWTSSHFLLPPSFSLWLREANFSSEADMVRLLPWSEAVYSDLSV